MDKNVTKKIDEAIADRMSPGCSLLVTRKGNTILDYSSGSFSDTDQKSVSSHTVYDLASVTKLYTAALVLRAVEEGNLSLDDKVSRYLPNFKNSSILIRELLTHQANFGIRLSSFRQDFPDSFREAISRINVPADASKEIHYENLTYIYLGFIMEDLCGLPLEEQFAQLFYRLGLEESRIRLNGQPDIVSPPTEIRQGIVFAGKTHDESAELLGGIAGNAGIFASTYDLNRFGQAWLEGEIISDNVFRLVLKDYSQAGERSQGLGWHQDLYGYSTKGLGIYLHPGYTGCLLAIRPGDSTVLSFCSNRTYFGRDNLSHRALLRVLIEEM
jgi:CubicO group peptidase (beta-lactamase class C family)